MYLYETHCHTKYSSACASIGAEELVNLYLKNGYTGIFITDHFLNGNTTVHSLLPRGTYKEKTEKYAESYERVKKAASGKLQVFFGLEYSYHGTDLLIYGIEPQKLAEIPELLQVETKNVDAFVRMHGGMTIQAHPFREAAYIDYIRIFTETEGVEVYNATNSEKSNRLAESYADIYEKIKTAGSDLHSAHQVPLTGVEFKERIVSEQDYIRLLRTGNGKIVRKKNILAQNI